MSRKYAALAAHLEKQNSDQIALSFAQIEEIIGFALPNSARKHGVWWSNSSSPGRHNDAWLNAGWETTKCNLKAHTISFQRISLRARSEPHATTANQPRRAKGEAFDSSVLTDTDFAADCAVTLKLRWKRLGAVTLSDGSKLEFPAAPIEAGLYRLIVRTGNRTTVYVGEAVNLKRRFGNYRRPGATQQTSLRLNALLTETLGRGGAIHIDVCYQDIGLSIAGVTVTADLADKAVRRMIEQAAIVAHGGIDVEMLNR